MALAPAAAAGREAFGSDMRLRVRLQRRGRQTTRYYYPDAMVLRDRELRPEQGDDELHVTRPRVIVEVLSRGSGRIDRGEKLDIYQSLPSVQAYVIVYQRQRRVERGAAASMQRAQWLVRGPGAAIFLTVLCLYLIGDGVRDALDPRLRSQ